MVIYNKYMYYFPQDKDNIDNVLNKYIVKKLEENNKKQMCNSWNFDTIL